MNGAIIIEGHVQGLSNTRALGEMGIPVYVVDVCHCLAQHSKYCKKHFICPPFISNEFIPFLIELGKQEQLKDWVIIPSNDHIVEQLSNHKEELVPYFLTIAPAPEVLSQIVNKRSLVELAKQIGTPVPATCYPENKEDVKNMRFPVLLKGNQGLSFYRATHLKAIQVDSLDEFNHVYQQVSKQVKDGNIMIQELIPFDPAHKVVSFTCFAEDGEIKTYWMGEKLREHPVKYGTGTYARSVNIPSVYASAKPLIKTLHYTGCCEVEFMRDLRDGEYKLIEINPRTWLWVGLAKACGINYAYMIYAYMNNLPIKYKTDYPTNIRWINWVTDTVFAWQSIFKGELTLRDYFHSLKGKKCTAIFDKHDIKPVLVFPFMSFYIAKKRK